MFAGARRSGGRTSKFEDSAGLQRLLVDGDRGALGLVVAGRADRARGNTNHFAEAFFRFLGTRVSSRRCRPAPPWRKKLELDMEILADQENDEAAN